MQYAHQVERFAPAIRAEDRLQRNDLNGCESFRKPDDNMPSTLSSIVADPVWYNDSNKSKAGIDRS